MVEVGVLVHLLRRGFEYGELLRVHGDNSGIRDVDLVREVDDCELRNVVESEMPNCDLSSICALRFEIANFRRRYVFYIVPRLDLEIVRYMSRRGEDNAVLWAREVLRIAHTLSIVTSARSAFEKFVHACRELYLHLQQRRIHVKFYDDYTAKMGKCLVVYEI